MLKQEVDSFCTLFRISLSRWCVFLPWCVWLYDLAFRFAMCLFIRIDAYCPSFSVDGSDLFIHPLIWCISRIKRTRKIRISASNKKHTTSEKLPRLWWVLLYEICKGKHWLYSSGLWLTRIFSEYALYGNFKRFFVFGK